MIMQHRGHSSIDKGYRLHKVELWNWGTFDEHIFTVMPKGESTLLIGQNGSGKSTLVDAILTLLVRPGVRNFNVAAGAKKRERDERSYLLGAFDRGSDEDGGIRVKYLRPKGEKYSVILACFRNKGVEKVFTIAQVLYLAGDQSVEKVYCFADGERSVREDFGRLESTESIVKMLKGRGIRATRTFQEFEAWFSKVTHIKPKAMEVFNQTVAIKDIQRLNDFIRDHMLEPHNWEEKFDRLLGHFTQLSEAHDIDRETGKSVSVYQDSSGQSGGEKAKLAFTILVAAVAYQYDLDPESSVSDRFHFVVVDEMFSKVDDQHAEYALELFRQFGLQVLIVAPLDAKARVTQPYVGSYLHAVKKNNRSAIYEMTAEAFEECAGRHMASGDQTSAIHS